METAVLLAILTAVAVPTGLWLFERYKRIAADGVVTLDEVLDLAEDVVEKAKDVKEQVEEIIDEAEAEKAE